MAASMPAAIAVTSGKGGVGKSAIALNLALALARSGRRTLLLDADFGLGNIALLAGIAAEWGMEDVLAGRCRAREAVVEGPAGLHVLAASSDGRGASWTAHADELLQELCALEAEYEQLVVDTGAGPAGRSATPVLAAGRALLVTTPEPAAIADAYATLKVLLSSGSALEVHLLVNMAESAREAGDIQEKFAELAARFLGAEIDNRGYIPLDRYVREAARRQVPFAQIDPPSPAAVAVGELAEWLGGSPAAAEGGGFFERALALRL